MLEFRVWNEFERHCEFTENDKSISHTKFVCCYLAGTGLTGCISTSIDHVMGWGCGLKWKISCLTSGYWAFPSLVLFKVNTSTMSIPEVCLWKRLFIQIKRISFNVGDETNKVFYQNMLYQVTAYKTEIGSMIQPNMVSGMLSHWSHTVLDIMWVGVGWGVVA